jgi:hypothetical protein
MEFLPLGTGRRDMLILGKEKHFPKRDKQLLCRQDDRPEQACVRLPMHVTGEMRGLKKL